MLRFFCQAAINADETSWYRKGKRQWLWLITGAKAAFFKIDPSRSAETFQKIIGAAIEVHRKLGPGYLEKVYEQAMVVELRHLGLTCAAQVPASVYYKGEKIHGHVLGLVVEGKVILELKSVEMLLPSHEAQILSYLKSTGLTVGLLINFKERLVKDGIKQKNLRVFFAFFATFAFSVRA